MACMCGQAHVPLCMNKICQNFDVAKSVASKDGNMGSRVLLQIVGMSPTSHATQPKRLAQPSAAT